MPTGECLLSFASVFFKGESMAYRFIIRRSKLFFTLKQPHYLLASASCLLWALLILGMLALSHRALVLGNE
jgi:hypothetical protein